MNSSLLMSIMAMWVMMFFSFLFFVLTRALLLYNQMFGLSMVPKTIAYIVAFIYLIQGVILPTPVTHSS